MEVLDQVLAELHILSNPANLEGMRRFGINAKNGLGVAVPKLRLLARRYRNNHSLALQLWDTDIHDARLLATMVEDATQVTEQQMENWVADFNSWDICDQCCGGVFDKTPYAFQKAMEWTSRSEEFVKRAGFAMMATLAVHDKNAKNENFLPFFNLILKEAHDERNFVKKAVNWALRQIGKRNLYLHTQAVETAQLLLQTDSKSAKWIATDALKELTNEKIYTRILKQKQSS